MDGLTPGRMVHFVIDGGEHRAAIVTAVPGMEVKTVPDFNQDPRPQLAALDSGIISLTVFTAPQDDLDPGYLMRGGSVGNISLPVRRIAGARFEEAGTTPGTWHWIEKA